MSTEIKKVDPAGTAPIWKRAFTEPMSLLPDFVKNRFDSTFEQTTPAAPPAEKPSLWNRFTGAVSGAKDAVAGALTAVKDGVVQFATHPIDTTTQVAQSAWKSAGEAASWAGDKLSAAWNDAAEFVSKGYESLKTFVSNSWNSITSIISKVFTGFYAHNAEVDRRREEIRKQEDAREHKAAEVRNDESKRLEDTVIKARELATSQQFQAEAGMIDKVTAPGAIDNGSIQRRKDREKAAKA